MEKQQLMLPLNKMVDNLKNKNIKFNYVKEENAENYLRFNNNYFNLTSYKNNFEKYYIRGEFVNKYIDLDFAYLIDLAVIDYRLRRLLFAMIIDIEHYLKLRILNQIENIDEEDGYIIVNKFLEKDFNDLKYPKKVHKSIIKRYKDTYNKRIYSKYDFKEDELIQNIPIYEFLEIITMGELIHFYDFYTKEYDLRKENKNVFILTEIVKLRNAVCHNSPILCDLDMKDSRYNYDNKIRIYLKRCYINLDVINNKLNNSRIRQITYTLFMFLEVVTSDGIKKQIRNELLNLFYKRIPLHKEYYKNNSLLKSIYEYFDKIIITYYMFEKL